MFTVEMLPAQRGDCLWLTYGTTQRKRHVFIDAGPRDVDDELIPAVKRRLDAVPGGANRVELLVITHVDSDHIEGMVPLLRDRRLRTAFRDTWFNGYIHLDPRQVTPFGAIQGEEVTDALQARPGRWNAAFGRGPVVRPDEGPLVRVDLPGGLEIVIVAPGTKALADLRPIWERTCAEAGIVPGAGVAPREVTSQAREVTIGQAPLPDIDTMAQRPFRDDTSKPNRTSISLVITFQGRSVLLTGDASVGEITAGLDRLATHGSVRVNGTRPKPAPTGARSRADRHRFAAVKLSHHGSQRNTSLPLLERIDCRYWLVSTDGAKFDHPDDEALARVVSTQRDPVFVFNYPRVDVADPVKRWIDAAAAPDARFGVRYPKRRPGITHRVS